jgi:ABC-2 type transport system ATP-binding protein
MNVLETENLTKRYGPLVALSELSLEIPKGSVYGFLGPNGSGKTTTLGIVLGTLNATSGSFSWFGNGTKDSNRLRIGALLETPNFYPYLNAEQNLEVTAHIKKIDPKSGRIEEVLKRVDLYDRRKGKFKSFSLGMKQRMAIAGCLLNDPEVLVLDEPTNGLDPQGISDMRNLISSIADEGKTIIIASHILDEIEKICTHAAILRKGKLISKGTLEDLLGGGQVVKISAPNMKEVLAFIGDKKDWDLIDYGKSFAKLSLPENLDAAGLNRLLAEQGIYLSELVTQRKTLENSFLEKLKS